MGGAPGARRLKTPAWPGIILPVAPVVAPFPIEPRLTPYIDRIRVLRPTPGRAVRVERLPDGTTSLMFRVTGQGAGELCVVGPRTRALFKRAPAVPLVVNLRLQPGGAGALLGVNPRDLVDRVALVDDLWGPQGNDLRDQLLADPEPSALVRRLQAALVSRSSRALDSSATRLSRRALRMLQERPDRLVATAAASLGVTPRHLRRVFADHVGVGPKRYARMVRLRRAARAAAGAPAPDWARIAADAGYFDQAHLIADFRDLIGVTPARFARRQLVHTAC